MGLFTEDTRDNYITTKQAYMPSGFVDTMLSNLHEFQAQILWDPELFEVKTKQRMDGTTPSQQAKQENTTGTQQLHYKHINYVVFPSEERKDKQEM